MALSRLAHASVFTGLLYRDEIADYYKANGIREPYGDTARRKIVPDGRRHSYGPRYRRTADAAAVTVGVTCDYPARGRLVGAMVSTWRTHQVIELEIRGMPGEHARRSNAYSGGE